MKITKVSNSIVFDTDKAQYVFPIGSLVVISNDESSVLNVRLKGSRKNIVTFSYEDVENIEATSANDLNEKITALTN